MPKITVLMTVYNGEKYLRSSIQSVLEQTYRDFEFLIIDDGSHDHSREIIGFFQDERITLHRNCENIGQTKSLNVGLKLVRTKYIARIDADDLAFPIWLEQQIKFLEAHPDYVVVSAAAVVIDSEGKIRKLLRAPCAQDEVLLRSLTASPVNHGGCVMHRSIILENGGYDEALKIAADYQLWSLLIRKDYKITTRPEVLMAIRVHENSLSICGRGTTDLREMSRIMRENIQSLTALDVDTAEVELLWKLCYDVADLDAGQFREGEKIFEEMYGSLRPNLRVSKARALDAFRKQILTIYVKRAFSFITDNKIDGIRSLSLDYTKKYGYFNAIFLFFMFSLFGRIFVRRLPMLYRDVSAFLANIKMSIRYHHLNRKTSSAR